MFFTNKKEKEVSKMDLTQGDIFEKNDRVPSTFVVDKVMDFSPAPAHVRLKEVGGNERTVTVALETLLNEHFWRLVHKN